MKWDEAGWKSKAGDSCSLLRPVEAFPSMTDINAGWNVWVFFGHLDTKCSDTAGGGVC